MNELEKIKENFKKGVIMIGSKNYKDALEKFDEIVGQHDENNESTTQKLDKIDLANVWHYKGICEEKLNDYNKACDSFVKANSLREEINKSHPDIIETCYHLGQVYKGLEKKDNAIEEIRKGQQVYEKIAIFSDRKIFDDLNLLKQSIESNDSTHLTNIVNGTHTSAHSRISSHSRTSVNSQKSDDANDVIQKLFKESSELIDKKDKRGAIKKLTEAEDLAEKNISDWETYEQVNQKLIDFYERNGESEKAIKTLDKSIDKMPEKFRKLKPGKIEEKGLMYLNKGKLGSALECFQEALTDKEKLSQDLDSSYKNLGMVYAKYGDYPKAIDNFCRAKTELEKSLPTFNNDRLADVLLQLALAYDKSGKELEAQNCFRKAGELLE